MRSILSLLVTMAASSCLAQSNLITVPTTCSYNLQPTRVAPSTNAVFTFTVQANQRATFPLTFSVPTTTSGAGAANIAWSHRVPARIACARCASGINRSCHRQP